MQVAVRVRPFNDREKAANSESIITMTGPTTVIKNPALEGAAALKQFSYDYSYWSIDESNPENYADQERVFKDLGTNILDNAFTGFNCSIFAYGQTGAGKSYSMLGYGADKGLIPRVCEAMYGRIDKISGPDCQVNVEVSFFEIYNENVFDLLNPTGNKSGLKVRNHPTTGPYVEDLSRLAVQSYDQIDQLMEEGSKARTVASTNMNATSSRSHAVFTIVLTITKGAGRAMVSKIHMVDLAGSERATATGASGQRLKEGANINKSLSTLGKVIAALAKKSDGKKNVFVPYRDSVLTWLLKESLGGNSKTIMLAAISPADINFEETLSTLRYADSAKQIKNAAVVNEDPTEKLIRELQEEVERLRQLLAEKERETQNASPSTVDLASALPNPSSSSSEELAPSSDSLASQTAAGLTSDSIISNASSIAEIRSQLMQSTKLMATLGKSWETKLAETDALRKERHSAFEEQGLGSSLIDQNLPNFVNLNEDPLLSGALIYYLRKGETQIGKSSNGVSPGRPQASILLGGLGVASDHCLIVYDGQEVWLHPRPDAPTFVNGIRLSSPRKLVHGCRVIIGTNHIFRFNHPESVQRRTEDDASSTPISASSSTTSASMKPIDYKFALEERAAAEIDALMANTLHFDLTSEEERLLEKQMKEYYEQKRVEMEDIDKQLEALKKSKDSVLDAIDYEQSRQELQTRKVSIELQLSKQKEKFASFSFRVWNEKLERQQLRESIARLLVLIEEANAISKELDKQVVFELLLRSSHPTHSIAETLFESGFGLYKRMIVEVRAIDLRDGRFFDWSQTAFSDLIEDLRAIYSSYLTANDDEVDRFLGPIPLPSKDSDLAVEAPSPFWIPSQEDALRMFAHINLRDLLYLNHTDIQAPVLDMNGKVYGQLHVELDRITGESPSSPRNDTSSNGENQVDTLVGREIEIVLRINKLTGVDLPLPSLYCSYQFWNSSPFKTEIGTLSSEGEQSQGATLNFFHEERFIISDAREDFLGHLENDPLVIELWSVHGTETNGHEKKFNLEELRKAYAASERDFSAQVNEDGVPVPQEQKEERYRMLASIMIQESPTPPGKPTEYKNVVTKQEPWNAPSVQFRLRKSVKTPRKVILQTAQLKGHPMSIESCDQVTLTIYPPKPLGSTGSTTGTISPATSSTDSLASSPTVSSPLASSASHMPTIVTLKVISVQDDRVEAEWEESPNVMTERNVTGTPRRRGRSAAPPPAAVESSAGESASQAPAQGLARSGSGQGIATGNVGGSGDDLFPPVVGELAFTLKLNRLAVPVRVTKAIGIKFLGAERVKTLSRTVSEVQMIEDLKMKEVLKTQEEQLAMSGSHFQLTFQQYRTVAKQVSVMIEEQKYTQKLVAASLLHDRLSNELALVEKLGALQTLGTLKRSMAPNQPEELGASSSSVSTSEVSNDESPNRLERSQSSIGLPPAATSSFVQVRYPRTKEDISKSISLVQQRIGELSSNGSVPGSQGASKGDVSVQVTVSDVNNRMESKVCGYLAKKAGKIWKTRWCVLSKLYFQVYKTEDDETPRDILDLTNARVNDTSSSQYPHSFAIVNWKDVWFLQAQHADDFKRWMDALDPERVLRELQSTKEKSLQSKLESTTRALKDSNDQVKSSAAELAEAQDTIFKREEEIVVLTNEVESLQSRIKTLEADIEALHIAPSSTGGPTAPKPAKDENNDSVSESSGGVQEPSAAINGVETIATELKEGDGASKRELEEAQLKIMDLEETILDLQSTVERLQRSVKLLEAENEENTADSEEAMKSMKQKLATMDGQIANLENQLDVKDDELRALQRELSKKDREIEKLSSSANVANELEEETKKQIEEWKKKHAAVADELADTESKLSQKERELVRKEKEVSSQQETIESLDRQVSKLTAQLKKSAAAASSSTHEDDTLQPSSSSSRLKTSSSRSASSASSDKDRAEVAELKATLKKMQDEISEKNREIRSLEFEHQKQLKEAMVDLKATVEMHEYDLEQKERELAKKTAELAAKTQLLMDTEGELDEANDRLHEMKRTVAAKDKSLSEKQKEIEKRDRDIHQLKQAIASDKAKFALQQSQESAAASSSPHSQLFGGMNKSAEESEKEKREAQLAKKEALIEDLKEEVEKLSRVSSDSRAELKESKRLISESQKEVSRKEAQIISKDRQIDELTKRVSDLERELADSERSALDFRRQLQSKVREAADLESAIDSWRDKVDSIKRVVEERERDVEEKVQEIEDLTSDFEQLERDSAVLQRELNEAGRQITQLDDVCFDLQRKLETALQNLEDATNNDEKAQLIRDHKRQAAQWASDLAERDRDVERADQAIKHLEKTLDKREKRINELEAALATQKDKFGYTSAAASKDASEVASLKREIAAKDAQLKRIQDDLESAQREAKRALRRADLNAEVSAPVASRSSRSLKETDSDASETREKSSSDSAKDKWRQKLEEANKSIVRLETESARKSAQIERLEKDRATQKALLADLEASVQSTRQASSSSSRHEGRIEELQTKLNEAVEEAKKQAKKAERAYKLELADKTNQIEVLRRRVESAQSAAQSAIRTRQSVASEPVEPTVIETVKRDPEMEKELFEMREKVLTLQAQLKARLSDLEDVQFSTRRQDTAVRRAEEKFEAEKERMEAKISTLEREVVQLRTRLQVRGNNALALGAYTDLDEVPIDWKIRCEQTEKELEALRQEVRRGHPNGSKLPVYPDIHTKVLKGEMDVLREAAGAKSSKIAELRDRQRELQEERLSLKSEALTLQKEKTEASSSAAASSRQTARLQEQLTSLQARLEEASRAENYLRKQNDQLLDERVTLVLAIKRAQIEVLAATGERFDVALPSSIDIS